MSVVSLVVSFLGALVFKNLHLLRQMNELTICFAGHFPCDLVSGAQSPQTWGLGNR